MKIIVLTEEHKKLYFVCLEDWSDEIKEAGDHKENWYIKMKDKGLCVKLALDDNGEVGGMIQYVPIEWGISDALYIDNKAVRTGPPPSYEKIKKKITRKVRKLPK